MLFVILLYYCLALLLQNESAFDEVFQHANFNTFVFRNRVKLETYNVSLSENISGALPHVVHGGTAGCLPITVWSHKRIIYNIIKLYVVFFLWIRMHKVEFSQSSAECLGSTRCFSFKKWTFIQKRCIKLIKSDSRYCNKCILVFFLLRVLKNFFLSRKSTY